MTARSLEPTLIFKAPLKILLVNSEDKIIYIKKKRKKENNSNVGLKHKRGRALLFGSFL